MKKTAPYYLLTLSILTLTAPTIAQQSNLDTLITSELSPVTVTAFRLETSDLTTPLSITNIGQRQLQSGTQQLSLDEVLQSVPGIFVQNGTNFAQDIRVSIRGFGARSAFGIRGVKILVDGFPESTPDGTAQVDAVDPGSLTGVSIIRSGTGGLHGNSSGGSINFNTMRFDDEEWGEVGATAGQYGFQKYQFRTGGGKKGKLLYSINSSFTKTNGYRDHSAMKNYLLNGGFLLPVDSTLTIRGVLTFVNSPLAQDPGALSQEQVDLDPTQARTSNLNFDTGESLWQLRTGLGFSKKIKLHHQLNGSIYHTDRSFLGKIPYDYIELERSLTGGTFSYGFKTKPGKLTWEMTAGIDLEAQSDDRKRYQNNSGEKGIQYADQTETFSTAGFFLVQKIGIGERFAVLPAFRYDRIAIDIDDHYLVDMRNDSFQQTYNAFNPTIGLSFLASQNLHFFLNGSRNFETPTILEITSTHTFGGEFYNYDLKPQRSKSLELGTKWLSANGKLRTEIALFRIWLKDEFVRYQGFEGESYYENVGKSSRKGLELSMSGQLEKHWMLNFNYTYSDFKFDKYGSVEGKQTPGIPKHQAGISLNYFKKSGFFFSVGNQYVSEIIVNYYSGYSNKAKPYIFGYSRAGWNVVKQKVTTEIFGGINNAFNQKYNANIRINGGTNFYEPAPPRNIYAGIKFKF
ncbi:MAG: TonB-dependent receptor [Saprospiraceae bacterium]|nr:TonB-dependent receptor [Saprospiraceae bacterium]MCF8248839.1 TonB-dependent receptor [Saprospiraceae bacterium]MCF8279870.1 TonB-dependent receptor [Bacteroidales bacterium]MCF8310124.1 TonB-dependent receptor [Saprospiraceae bacterium]MCF8439024.1 TonB-dependent receptor [Saprospiraceae bacterium]